MKERPILFSAPMVRALLAGTKTQTRRVVKPQAAVLTPAMAHGFGIPIPEMSKPVIPCPHGVVGDRLWVKETWKADHIWDDFEPTCIPFAEPVFYCADDGASGVVPFDWGKVRPSIFMRRWMSRITREITGIRIERLQEISEADAIAEGVALVERTSPKSRQFYRDYRLSGDGSLCVPSAKESFRSLWNSINLDPSPIVAKDSNGKRRVVAYECFPWSFEDFDAKYPGVRDAGSYRDCPITVTANPWVWVISFKKL